MKSTIREQIKFIGNNREQEHRFAIDALRHINRLLPDIDIPQNDVADFVYLTMCGKADLDMTKASIISFCLNSDIHAKEYIIVSDGSWTITEGKDYFGNFVSPLRLVLWNECVNDISTKFPEMETWGNQQIWGRKLAAIISFSQTSKVLFCDSDVLWYGSPFDRRQLNDVKIKLSTDNDYFYDRKYIQFSSLTHIYENYCPINCGVVLIGDFNRIITPEARECMRYESEHLGNFSEQTVFAILNMKYQCTWRTDEIKVDISDILSDFNDTIDPRCCTIARHYVWRLKWVFWKDYVTMRIHRMNHQ